MMMSRKELIAFGLLMSLIVNSYSAAMRQNNTVSSFVRRNLHDLLDRLSWVRSGRRGGAPRFLLGAIGEARADILVKDMLDKRG